MEEEVRGEHAPHVRRVRDQIRRGRCLLVGRPGVGPQRLGLHEPHGQADGLEGEVPRHAVQGFLGLMEQAGEGVVHEGVQPLHVGAPLAVPQSGVPQEDGRQGVGHAPGDHLLTLQIASEDEGHVAGGGEVGGQAVEVPLVVLHLVRGAAGSAHRPDQTGGHIRQGVLHHEEHVLREAADVVALLEGLHDVQEVGVGAHHALPKDHEGAGQGVGPLHGDPHRDHEVPRLQGAAGAPADGGAGQHIGGVLKGHAGPVGGLLLEDGGEHAGGLVVVHHRRDQVRAGLADEGLPRDPAQVLLHPPHVPDGDAELLADAGVGPRGDGGGGGGGAGPGGQGDAPPLAELLHEEVPALPRLGLAPQHAVHGDEHVRALHSAVHECIASDVMPAADLEPRVVPLQQSDGDPLASHAFQQPFRVMQVEGQSDNPGHWGQRDVPLLKADPHAKNPILFYNIAIRLLHGGSVGAGVRGREGEARDQLPATQPWEKVLFLCWRTVAHQQLPWPQRVGNCHGDSCTRTT
mmetsp:Transcript_10642/g.18901  ORF Transcript_10642/g.18901 Transcript_10642/m.18901 type:complete len:517 (+) Transcript_10642:1552-3102(+)